jgi:formylmethanofuran--tetrahydromethanopterin N-formyltransferase
MQIRGTEILDQYAEAFSARYARLVVTAVDNHWVEAAAREATGYAASVVGCDCEAGVERYLASSETPDGRPGVALLFFTFKLEQLAHAIAWRVGECVLTCPTTACFNGLRDAEEVVPLGGDTREFADGFEERGTRGEERDARSSILDTCTFWRLPVWDGEFVVDAVAGVGRGVAGGNLVIHAKTQAAGLAAAQRAAGALADLPNIIMPFPGGVCRAGSKVGALVMQDIVATIDEAYCPTLRDQVETQLVEGAAVAYELIINGVDLASVGGAMRVAIEAAAGPEVLAIGARSFGGKLGKQRISLRELFS